jgi:site-specific DNA recombinase
MNYFLYVRKSTDIEDKQVRSIEDQLSVLRALVKEQNLTIAHEFIEKQSAKKPGRLVFNEMLFKINKGEAQGIICWKLDRLARNPVDAAQISWMLQEGIVIHIQTHDKSYYSADNVLMMQMEFGIANQYIRDLSTNTKRGMHQKAKRGEYPGLAPIGYINDLRTKTITIDKVKAPIVKAAFELYAKDQCRLEDISEFFKNNGLLSRAGKPFKLDKISYLLSNPIYCGLFRFAGELYQGKHQPIITKRLFDQAQEVLAYRGRPHKETKNNPQILCGLFKCGECGRSVTAEQRTKKQKNGNIHNYVYYHCTKRNTDCSQEFVRDEVLIPQLTNILKKFVMPEAWAEKLLILANQNLKTSSQTSATFVQELQSKIEGLDQKLQRLQDMYLEQDIERESYREQKNKLVLEKKSLEEQIARLIQKQNAWFEPLTKFIKDASLLGEITHSPDLTAKKSFAQKIFGSNLFLKNQKIEFTPQTQWASLLEALENKSKLSESLILVALPGIEPGFGG